MEAVSNLVISCKGSKIFDDRGQADSQRVELASHNAVELKRAEEGQMFLVVHHLVMSECENVKSRLNLKKASFLMQIRTSRFQLGKKHFIGRG
jgi:hypothetical protein